jgi:hypothetical protein
MFIGHDLTEWAVMLQRGVSRGRAQRQFGKHEFREPIAFF